MAKKKNVEPKEEEEDEISDLEDDDLEELDDDSLFPDIQKKKEGVPEQPVPSPREVDLEEEDFDEVFEDELEPLILDYKYIKPGIIRTHSENDFELIVDGQSHGFCNIFVKHLLNIEGVNAAAYKVNRIDPPKIFLRIEDGHEVKDIVQKCINSLRENVKAVQDVFKKLM
ncbi:MAG: RpoL/Rpb11 RNA polymerase subunit family protein [Promethearchaeota archaeon]